MLPDLEIAKLERERDRFKAGVFRIKGSPHEAAIRRLAATITSKKATWKKMVRKQYRLYTARRLPGGKHKNRVICVITV